MSHDESHASDGIARIIRMANQIGTFFLSKPYAMGVDGVAEHINKFWEPRMRRHFFDVYDAGGDGLLPIVMDAAPQIRRPNAPAGQGIGAGADADAGAPTEADLKAGATPSRIAASQG